MIAGKDFDRLSFFPGITATLATQVGAPKPEESFDELFSRVRTME